MSFGEGTNFTANRKTCGINTSRSVHIKVEKYSVSGETRMELDRHGDTIVIEKECM